MTPSSLPIGLVSTVESQAFRVGVGALRRVVSGNLASAGKITNRVTLN